MNFVAFHIQSQLGMASSSTKVFSRDMFCLGYLFGFSAAHHFQSAGAISSQEEILHSVQTAFATILQVEAEEHFERAMKLQKEPDFVKGRDAGANDLQGIFENQGNFTPLALFMHLSDENSNAGSEADLKQNGISHGKRELSSSKLISYLVMGVLLLSVLSAIPKFLPNIKGAEHLFGSAPDAGGKRLLIQNMTTGFEFDRENQVRVLVVKADIINPNADRMKEIPPVVILLKNSDGVRVSSWVHRMPNPAIGKGAVVEMIAKKPKPPSEARKVELQFQPNLPN